MNRLDDLRHVFEGDVAGVTAPGAVVDRAVVRGQAVRVRRRAAGAAVVLAVAIAVPVALTVRSPDAQGPATPGPSADVSEDPGPVEGEEIIGNAAVDALPMGDRQRSSTRTATPSPIPNWTTRCTSTSRVTSRRWCASATGTRCSRQTGRAVGWRCGQRTARASSWIVATSAGSPPATPPARSRSPGRGRRRCARATRRPCCAPSPTSTGSTRSPRSRCR